MLKVRPDILPKLRCSLCEGYLNTSPVMAKPDKCQICGKCFRILPSEEKTKCVRQVGYEALAEMLLFPCRYNFQGCPCEFPLNETDNHELECAFRFSALGDNVERPEDVYEVPNLNRNVYESNGEVWTQQDKYSVYTTSPTTSFTVLDTSECISVQSTYTLKENQLTQTPTTLKYETRICGNENKGATLSLRSSPRTYANILEHFRNNPLKLSIEGAISLSTFQNVFCKVSVSPLQEPVYDIIRDPAPSTHPKCARCTGVVKSEIYHCSFGHDVCRDCKGVACALCTSSISPVPLYYCRNFSKGCHVYLLSSEQYLHGKDCEFGEFKCLLEPRCSEVAETLFALKGHLKDKHLTEVILSNLVSKQASGRDELWIMLAFDSLFRCKRFCYEADVEFLVEYVGPHQNASNFKYEIYIKSDDNKSVKLTRGKSCVGWNSSALDQAVIVAKNELHALKVNKVNFTYTLNLVQVLRE